jgi:hypothetical protein
LGFRSHGEENKMAKAMEREQNRESEEVQGEEAERATEANPRDIDPASRPEGDISDYPARLLERPLPLRNRFTRLYDAIYGDSPQLRAYRLLPHRILLFPGNVPKLSPYSDS